MAFPNFHYCAICEIVRPELGGKYILLGFYGVAPAVEIMVADVNRPMFISFLAGSEPVMEANVPHECVIIITRPDGVIVYQTPPQRLLVAQGKGVAIPLTFNIAPPILPGRYSIQIMVNSEPKLDTSFSVRAALPVEIKRQAIGAGAPN